MSSLLFSLAEEFLSRYLSHLLWVNSTVPMSSSRNKSASSHLLYADDVLLFCEGMASNMKNLSASFSLYRGLSGQHVNWSKSFIYFRNVIHVSHQRVLLSLSDMRASEIPFNYLGVPLL